jgi:NADH-quinone oxidoreductase subunit F
MTSPAAARPGGVDIDLAKVDEIVASKGRTARSLIAILRAIQDEYGYLPESALRRVTETAEVPPSQVVGVASFYSQFRTTPGGRHTIKVCIGTACHVKGADKVYDAFKSHLGIAADEDTDADMLFTVDKVACLGCCMLAPAVQIDDVTYGHVEPGGVGGVLADFLASAAASGQGRAPRKRAASPVGQVRLCLCSSCVASGASDVFKALGEEIAALGLAVDLKVVGCTGISFETPLVEVSTADGAFFRYGRARPENVRDILTRHFTPPHVSTRLKAAAARLLNRLLTDESWEPVTRFCIDVRDGVHPAYEASQVRIATEHSGHLDPLDIDDYLAHDGFKALEAALDTDDVIERIVDSGLRGRGGAGFPTGWKWAAVKKAHASPKYVICNGDEGDPGAFMDRMILESFPFRVIEGLAIAATAVGAEEAFFYVRAEYPLAAHRLREALAVAAERSIIGKRVMGRDRSLKIKVVEGAGAFVCGEETALIAAVEGRRGMPRYRPPYPSESGLDGKPTLVNNAETLALVPWILRHGPDAFAAIGTESSKGTKSFALAGKIENGGLIEVPMGLTLREVVEQIGGGIQGGRALKAVQVGGPSGGCVPASLADTPIDYEALRSAGAIMGSGGLVVLDDTDCMVDVARYFLAFTQMESCGKCTFCRIGTRRMLEILERLCNGEGRAGDVEELEHLARITSEGSLCGLGRTAPNPVLSTIMHFRDEYEAHIEGRCPAKRCRALIEYTITDDCIGCTRCAQNCPAEAIQPRPYERHEIDQEKCTKCDTCRQVCPADAVKVE